MQTQYLAHQNAHAHLFKNPADVSTDGVVVFGSGTQTATKKPLSESKLKPTHPLSLQSAFHLHRIPVLQQVHLKNQH